MVAIRARARSFRTSGDHSRGGIATEWARSARDQVDRDHCPSRSRRLREVGGRDRSLFGPDATTGGSGRGVGTGPVVVVGATSNGTRPRVDRAAASARSRWSDSAPARTERDHCGAPADARWSQSALRRGRSGPVVTTRAASSRRRPRRAAAPRRSAAHRRPRAPAGAPRGAPPHRARRARSHPRTEVPAHVGRLATAVPRHRRV